MVRIFVSDGVDSGEKPGRGGETNELLDCRAPGELRWLAGLDRSALDTVGEEKGMDLPSLSRRRVGSSPPRSDRFRKARSCVHRNQHLPNEIAHEAAPWQQATGPPRPRADDPTWSHPIQT